MKKTEHGILDVTRCACAVKEQHSELRLRDALAVLLFHSVRTTDISMRMYSECLWGLSLLALLRHRAVFTSTKTESTTSPDLKLSNCSQWHLTAHLKLGWSS